MAIFQIGNLQNLLSFKIFFNSRPVQNGQDEFIILPGQTLCHVFSPSSMFQAQDNKYQIMIHLTMILVLLALEFLTVTRNFSANIWPPILIHYSSLHIVSVKNCLNEPLSEGLCQLKNRIIPFDTSIVFFFE
ncbi:hypothetical protein CEXT_215321 [Caerostris extrusa]|uniref:Uncharacterized protein n=1 Tax=Caerostris extrusa TaxID=172846 RepID=A0AAV4WLW4_CAEEX|nr:hypothetical protein CEXT_215321 [Caerostris extrusa]